MKRLRTTTLLSALLVLAAVACGTSEAQKQQLVTKSDFHYKLAYNSYMDKDITTALSEAYQAISINENNAQAQHLLGFIYMGRQEYSQALKYLEKAVQIDKNYHEARANLGALMLAMEDWQKAIDILMPLTSQPLYSTPYIVNHNIGFAYYQLKQYALAERYTKSALFLNQSMCLAYSTLGLIYEKQGKRNDAIETWQEGNRVCPNYQDPFFHLGMLLLKAGRPQEADAAFTKCMKLAPESVMGRRCARRL